MVSGSKPGFNFVKTITPTTLITASHRSKCYIICSNKRDVFKFKLVQQRTMDLKKEV